MISYRPTDRGWEQQAYANAFKRNTDKLECVQRYREVQKSPFEKHSSRLCRSDEQPWAIYVSPSHLLLKDELECGEAPTGA